MTGRRRLIRQAHPRRREEIELVAWAIGLLLAIWLLTVLWSLTWTA